VVTIGQSIGADASLSAQERDLPSTAEIQARVITFHVDPERLEDMKTAMDKALDRFKRYPEFRGLLCLERGENRHEIVAITLWADSGLKHTERDAERTRKTIAATTDLGVSTKSYNVFRLASTDGTPHGDEIDGEELQH
jgi:hypothetical protein